MSVLPDEVNTALTRLLSALTSSDNNLRSNAEEQLNSDWVAQRPDVLLMGLVEQMQDALDPTVRGKLCLYRKERAEHGADECPHGLWYLDSIICCSPLPAHIYQDEEATKQHGAEGIVLDAPAATKNGHSDKTSAIFGCRHSACSQEQGWRCSGGNCKAIRR